jgi:hypothetical protein
MSEGYFELSNVMVPLNNREKGKIAQVALDELERWQSVAISWPVYTDGRCNRCGDCHENLWFSKDPQGGKYQYTDDEILALKVAHVRQCHSKTDYWNRVSETGSATDNG